MQQATWVPPLFERLVTTSSTMDAVVSASQMATPHPSIHQHIDALYFHRAKQQCTFLIV